MSNCAKYQVRYSTNTAIVLHTSKEKMTGALMAPLAY